MRAWSYGERRTEERVALRCPCKLQRRKGSSIAASTLDIGPGGMRVTADRPLAADEVLHFDLALPDGGVVDGEARVLREQGYKIYALRFESPVDAGRAALQTGLHTG